LHGTSSVALMGHKKSKKFYVDIFICSFKSRSATASASTLYFPSSINFCRRATFASSISFDGVASSFAFAISCARDERATRAELESSAPLAEEFAFLELRRASAPPVFEAFAASAFCMAFGILLDIFILIYPHPERSSIVYHTETAGVQSFSC